jgi:NTP pyrophosphatase (non-canonical NTP hydrolase)
MNKELLNYIQRLSLDDKKSLSQKALKVGEEVGELSKVVLPFDNAFGTTHRFVERESILEEVADVILTALSVAYDRKFTHDEIESMMTRKADKWARLQQNERNLKYPVPFEIHITVKPDKKHGDKEIESMEYFKRVCEMLTVMRGTKVKPIILDLYTSNDTIINDVMTSSHHFGTNASVYETCKELEADLLASGYIVERLKIESVPWHPASPKLEGEVMPKNCYFEAHIPVILHPSDKNRLESTIAEFRKTLYLHKSANTFKKHEDGRETIMLTYRDTNTIQVDFETNVNNAISFLKNREFEIGKAHKEFSVYDTKISHDAAWLTRL